jgi:hypothetical protein
MGGDAMDEASSERLQMDFLREQVPNLMATAKMASERNQSWIAYHSERMATAITCVLDYVARLEVRVNQLENP